MKPNTSYSSNYERMSGNCTRLVAAQMLQNLSPPITPSSYILDNACGPGIVSEQIKLLHPDAKIMATDWSPAMIEETQNRIEKEGWSNIQTGIEDVRDLKGLEDGTFSHAFTNLGMLVPGDDDSGVRITSALFRVLKVGGVALVSSWADRVWLNAFYNTARAIRPNEEPQKLMALMPEMMKASWLAAQLEDGRFGNNIEVKPCVTYTEAGSLDELVNNMLLAKQMFFSGFSDGEMENVKGIFKEELKKLRTFEEVEGGVRIEMKAWIGIGWKKGDELEVPV
ncbi:S-adenosyl-L-methionine-dependent methyltransferase [Mollisia scopiformis]|uniref:S-adenosyl-L-methionine-dependent methyltransferase n=1 Tax=Mollisia scopiformis TaxID=149040 RepID=A0A194XG41_MOLSC|nr:S-adenosyl-L-methionine-dependent methyltransferase [Mollisia scopiformis]KUJ19165.1 S-adenosyl-L-methionine-dependent methyltransferase [Mollisia scopiformis]